MRALIRIYDALLILMALIAAAILVWLMVSVVLSVAMRNVGVQPWAWLFTSAEYGIFYMTMLGAPWLVRERGHVHIELVTAALTPRLRRIVSRGVAAACVAVSLILAWYGLELFLTNVERNDYDVRAYFYPRWLLTITFPIAFTFMAIEFSRFVFGKELMHSGEAGIHE
ncbi:MAG: TRAP transporter small permease [Rhodobacteraceae bacterium]|nr:TRAP transporter small permease [Paracoccaceae bacterium]